jgi:hypothetical protein
MEPSEELVRKNTSDIILARTKIRKGTFEM